MKIKLTIENDRGLNIGSVELKPRGISFDMDSANRIMALSSDAREEPLTLIARNVGRSIGPEEVFQLYRAVTSDPTSKVGK